MGTVGRAIPGETVRSTDASGAMSNKMIESIASGHLDQRPYAQPRAADAPAAA